MVLLHIPFTDRKKKVLKYYFFSIRTWPQILKIEKKNSDFPTGLQSFYQHRVYAMIP